MIKSLAPGPAQRGAAHAAAAVAVAVLVVVNAPPAVAATPLDGAPPPGGAQRPSERIAIVVPTHARASTPRRRRTYAVTVRGYTARPAWLAVFVDYEACAAAVADERAHAAPSVTFEVNRRFSRRSLWESGVARTDHVCAYLVQRSSGALLAERSATFTIR
jgi:hypothetical protein